MRPMNSSAQSPSILSQMTQSLCRKSVQHVFAHVAEQVGDGLVSVATGTLRNCTILVHQALLTLGVIPTILEWTAYKPAPNILLISGDQLTA